MKELKISYMSKDKRLPAGIYAFEEPNIWYPVIYFRKPRKIHNKKVYEQILKYLEIKEI